jgi:DNA invertase Pin-like site-specific DNA recombinase
MADEERNRIRKRQREGINMAIINRTKFGRSKIRISEKFVEVYNQWKKGQITVVKAMQELGVKKTTYYKLKNTKYDFNNKDILRK